MNARSFALLPAILVLSSAASAPTSNGISLELDSGPTAPTCPTGKPLSEMTPAERRAYEKSQMRTYPNAAVLVGVDPLGRILAAIDGDHDGLADEYALFTDRVRLEGPWSVRLDGALVVSRLSTLKIQALDGSFVLATAVNGNRLPRLDQGKAFDNVFLAEDGLELARMLPGVGEYGNALLNMSLTEISTWPANFEKDLLSPGTTCGCSNYNCQKGGCHRTSCSIGPEDGCTRTQCSTSCGTDPSVMFACCNCTLIMDPCRCISCGQDPQ